MGLKTTNFKIESHNITLADAYARCLEIRADIQGFVVATFGIFSQRSDSSVYAPVDTRYINFSSDKDLPLWEQAYTQAKLKDFQGWQDDIVTEVTDGTDVN